MASNFRLEYDDLETDAEPEFSLSQSEDSPMETETPEVVRVDQFEVRSDQIIYSRLQTEPQAIFNEMQSGTRNLLLNGSYEATPTPPLASSEDTRQSSSGKVIDLRCPDGPSSSPFLPGIRDPESPVLKNTGDKDGKSIPSYLLPLELREEYFDVLIIHADEDLSAAEKLKNGIEKSCSEAMEIPFTAALWQDVAVSVRSHVEWLDKALAQCTYIFVIYTQHLKDDPVFKNMTNASYWYTVTSKERNRFCTVFLEKIAKQNLDIPAYLNQIRELGMWRDNWKMQVEKSIEIGPRIKKYELQGKKIAEYLKKEVSVFYGLNNFQSPTYKNSQTSLTTDDASDQPQRNSSCLESMDTSDYLTMSPEGSFHENDISNTHQSLPTPQRHNDEVSPIEDKDAKSDDKTCLFTRFLPQNSQDSRIAGYVSVGIAVAAIAGTALLLRFVRK